MYEILKVIHFCYGNELDISELNRELVPSHSDCDSLVKRRRLSTAVVDASAPEVLYRSQKAPKKATRPIIAVSSLCQLQLVFKMYLL